MAPKESRKDESRDFEKNAAEAGRHVAKIVQQGAQAVESYLARWTPDEEVALRTRAIEKHTRALKKYEKSLTSARQSMHTLSLVSLGLGIPGVITAVTMQADGPGPGLLIGSLVTGLIAWRKRLYLRTSTPPSAPQLPPAPTPSLIEGAIGWEEAERLSRVRRQLHALIPAIASIHADAGQELERADEEAGTALVDLIKRLAVLHRISMDLSDSHAATAATAAAREVRGRLATGVKNYEQLLAAAATMMAAPDLGRSSDQVLAPAIQTLTAYAHGLSISADAFSSPDRSE